MDLKAKLQELVLGDGEALRQFTPSFTKYTICHKDSATGSGWISGGLDSCIVTAHHIKGLTTEVYKEVQ